MEAAIPLCDLDVVDAGLAAPHQSIRVELPLLIAIGAMPLAACIAPFVLKTHSDAVAVERPEVLDQTVVELLGPFAREEGDDGRAALKKFRAIAPAAVLGIGERDPLGVARIPGVLRHGRLLRGGFLRERWDRRTGHDGARLLLATRLYRDRLASRWRHVEQPFIMLNQPSSKSAAISGSAAPGPR